MLLSDDCSRHKLRIFQDSRDPSQELTPQHEAVPHLHPPHLLDYHPPASIFTMKEIGLERQGVSPHPASDPFRLFIKEAIMQMRHERPKFYVDEMREFITEQRDFLDATLDDLI